MGTPAKKNTTPTTPGPSEEEQALKADAEKKAAEASESKAAEKKKLNALKKHLRATKRVQRLTAEEKALFDASELKAWRKAEIKAREQDEASRKIRIAIQAKSRRDYKLRRNSRKDPAVKSLLEENAKLKAQVADLQSQLDTVTS